MDCRCTRRAVLRGAGAALAASAIGCGTDVAQTADGGAPDAGSNAHFTTCGTNQICVDLTKPQNSALIGINGNIRFLAPNGDTLIVIRVDATTVDTLSDVCTHAGCEVNYSSGAMNLLCPCHGSLFSLSGTVLRGPAIAPLKSYVTTFDHTAGLVTITL